MHQLELLLAWLLSPPVLWQLRLEQPCALQCPQPHAAKAIELDSDNSALYRYRCCLVHKLQTLSGTRSYDAQAPSILIQYFCCRSNRSVAYLKAGNAQRAVQDAEKCTQLKEDWDKVHFRLGAAQEALGEYEKVLQLCCDQLC